MFNPQTRPKIVNVVSTANLNHQIDVKKMAKLTCCIYDQITYGGRCGYVKTPDMKGKVSVFITGKMISVGANSIKSSFTQLHNTTFYLRQNNVIEDSIIKPVLRNVVAVVDVKHKIPIEKLSPKITGAIYEPEVFPGMIVKGLASCSFLVFASGKIVITGANSSSELNTSSYELLTKLSSLL